MNNSTDNTSAAADLAYIHRIMEKTRLAVGMRGDPFILWGVVVLLGLLGNYLFMRFGPLPGWVWYALWGGLILIGWLLTVLSVRRNTRQASTLMGRMIGMVWLACSVVIVILIFAGIPTGAISPTSIMPLISLMIGVGLFMTGCLMSSRWTSALAFGWWACAVAEFVWNGLAQLLIFAMALVLFYIAPGIVLNLQARRAVANQ